MTCWIGVDRKGDRRIVRLVGEFTVALVPELLTACEPASGPVELDLADLMWADAAGIDALVRVRQQGVSLVGTPNHLKSKLDAASDAPTRSAAPEGRKRP